LFALISRGVCKVKAVQNKGAKSLAAFSAIGCGYAFNHWAKEYKRNERMDAWYNTKLYWSENPKKLLRNELQESRKRVKDLKKELERRKG
jgi:hypothetical protein